MGYIDGNNLSTKSHAKAGVLCLIGGLLGMHRFYVEKNGTATIMGCLFISSFVAFTIHPIAWGVILGMDTLITGVDFIRIMSNDFEDSMGKKLSPENTERDHDPLFGMLFWASIVIYSLIFGVVFENYIPLIAMLFIFGIFTILELLYIQKH